MQRQYEVEVIEARVYTYLVAASSEDEAIDAAMERYSDDDEKGEWLGAQAEVIDVTDLED